ncbi:hypothetical protein BLJAPNOD_05197 [Ensifer sp. M14]|uniref:Uncharacterized protein n=2 Tax=Sinorhizobium sp. M14 TaxID=430451 RepID=A0A142BPI6_9HYPH|nr:hypothetical protein [Ensifer sp. M14]AMP34994.1 hypothetical protein pSinB_131 [Sinorhizobium sp. M14]RDL47971.1 hypothetical protein BLJAPNOD_05197 [Ensifer sp. M14]
MPEQNGLTRSQRMHTLSKAEGTRQIVRIDCMYCRITHRYRCRDLLLLCGDVPIDEIARHFRCEKCNHKHYLCAVFELPWPADTGKLRIRKLVNIKTVRKPVWKDDVY